MPRWFTHVAVWTLLLTLIFMGFPGTGERVMRAGETSGEFRTLQRRLDRLERENFELRDELVRVRTLSDRLDELDRVVAERSAPVEGTPLRLFEVPSVVEFCGERLPLERPEVHQRFEEEWYRYLVNRHWVLKWHRRARAVFPVVESKLAARGMPDDLKYVLVIESGVEPRAVSTAGAVGWWQFIASTGKQYGLKRSKSLDERRDLDRATDAALDYLSDLHEKFGSWPLALSAYNAGARRVEGSMKEQGSTDFYDLVLPRETEAYWFKAAAARAVLSDPQRYQIELPHDGWAPVACDTLQIRVLQARLELRDLIAPGELSYRELKSLNPSFRRAWLPSGTHKIVLPTKSVTSIVAGLSGAKVVDHIVGRPRFARDDSARSQADRGASAGSSAAPTQEP